jgi:hypothetical protein
MKKVLDIDRDGSRLRSEIIATHEKLLLLRSSLYNIHDHSILQLIKLEKEIEEIQEQLGLEKTSTQKQVCLQFLTDCEGVWSAFF